MPSTFSKLFVGAVGLAAAFASAQGRVYFRETFDDDTWEQRWVQSEAKPDYGQFKVRTVARRTRAGAAGRAGAGLDVRGCDTRGRPPSRPLASCFLSTPLTHI